MRHVSVTGFLAYESLTWPEVAALPRDTPLIISLGEGYSRRLLAEALGHPPQIGMLPALPFGWPGSGLVVSQELIGRLVANLLDSLRDDGFSRVYALTPPAVDLGLGPARITLPHPSYAHPTGPLPGPEASEKVILIPIGHTEQHGYHLPLSTDSLIIEAIGEGTATAAPELVDCLPVFAYGVSTHRPSFAGTLNCGGQAFEAFWTGVIDVLVERGFDRFYLISGHGGNCSFLVNVVKYAGERHRHIFCATTWLHTSGHIAGPVVEKSRRSARGGMGHAGELETAMMLALRPELVYMDRVVDETDFISTDSYYMDWLEGGALVANPPWADDTKTGAYGAGSLATAGNGRLWLDAAIEEKVAHVREIQEQQTRRLARRQSGYGLWGDDRSLQTSGKSSNEAM